MIFHKSVFYYLFVFAIVFSHLAFPQVIFRDLPNYKLNSSDQFLFDISSSRDIIPLNGTWKVYTADDKKKEKVNVIIPSVFEGKGEFVFEKSFNLTSKQIDNNKISLNFFGINYSADISVNNAIIYRHPGGEFPFSLPIPRDLLRSDKANVISVKLFYELDALNTIPLKQRFLFPQNLGGIIRDVFLHLTPNVSITDFSFKKDIDIKTNKALISIQSVVDNKEFRKIPDSLGAKSDFVLKSQILSKDGASVIASEQNTFRLDPSKRIEIKNNLTISSPVLWSPDNPYSYIIRLELYQGDQLVDRSDKSIALYSLQLSENNFILNGKDLYIYGVTYSASDFQYGSLSSYERMESDLALIKQAGFNAVRFSRELPHPYYLRLCEKLGLLAFVELPLSNLPEGLAASQNFVERSKNYLSGLLSAYSDYSAIAGVGFGSGYLFSSDKHRALLSNLAEQVKKSKNTITYASFFDFGYQEISNLDIYGIELLNKQPGDVQSEVENLKNAVGTGKLFIGEATYVVNIGQTDGYVNKFSYEAQAKFFDDMFSFYEENQLTGFFVNTMYDIRGNYRSIISGYNKDNVYNIGLVSEDRKQDRLAFKILSARMKNTEKVTIPIGSEKDDAPMIFIVTGLVLALLMGVLVNSGRKFRDDASRALLRPYNFFADVRDQRIISAYHSLFLGAIISLVISLILANLFYYIRNNVLFERIILSFGSQNLIAGISYLAWNPVNALIWLFVISISMMFLLTIVITACSFFVRTKVYLSSVFFTIVWSLLPVVLLIPLGIVLYRLLNTGAGNIYIYIFLILFSLWMLYRLLKGISVIFDV
ncbi:MAG TPA: glycoside hydrolase family 2 TIM barrel-domain containing protein, partial [Ignavibacteriaceae bacterium]|nr:glycoside hydrolase family 2 TIM barrel-domain containing protein [Ignavibacteriaceae bacterium]